MPTQHPELTTTELARDLDGSFPDVVRTYQDGIFSGVYRLVPNAADAEDATQETFVRAYRALRRYDPERIRSLRLEPWLWTIALNVCRNAARTRKRKPAGSDLAAIPEPAASADTAAAAIEAVTADEWHRRLSTLPGPMRAAVVLRHVVGLGYGEISEALDRPIGTVKSDVHRALTRLSDLLVEESEVSP